MGIQIDQLSIFEGAITVNDIYCNIRDITITKDENGYKLSFTSLFKVNDKIIDAKSIEKLYDEVPDKEAWALCYTLLKEILTGEGLNFTDA